MRRYLATHADGTETVVTAPDIHGAIVELLRLFPSIEHVVSLALLLDASPVGSVTDPPPTSTTE